MNQHAIPRLMKMNDKEGITKLSRGVYVFDGISFDYLPYCFERWMESSTHVCYVLEGENKELIAFHCDTLLDEGETLFTEGLRTLESMRGTGLRSVLNRFIEEHRNTASCFSKIKRIRKAVGYKTEEARAQTFQREKLKYPEITELCTRRTRFIKVDEFSKDILAGFYTSISIGQLVEISSSQAFNKKEHYPGNLIPEDLLISDWTVYDSTLRNFIILESGGHGNWEHQFWSYNIKGVESQSFAISSYAIRGGNLSMVLNIYPLTINDYIFYLYHAIHTLSKLNNIPSNNTNTEYIHVWIPSNFVSKQVIEIETKLSPNIKVELTATFLEAPYSTNK